MAKGSAEASVRLVSDMSFCRNALALGLALRRENEAHAAAGHAAEHPETPEILAEIGRGFSR